MTGELILLSIILVKVQFISQLVFAYVTSA
jgi:hypothetical protein